MKLAQIEIAPDGLQGYGKFGLEGGGAEGAVTTFADFISMAIGLMTVIAIVMFVISIFTGAIGILSSGSDKQALEGSRKKIFTGLTGLAVVIAAIFIIRVVGFFLGFENILDLEALFNQLIGGSTP